MVRLTLLDETLMKLQREVKRYKSLVLYGEPEVRLIIYFSYGSLADSYVEMAEQMMREKKSGEASYFTEKAELARHFTTQVFGRFPEKDYYSGSYKVPKDMFVETPIEDLMLTAQFCLQNMQTSEEAMQDAKKLRNETYKKIRGFPQLGIEGQTADALLAFFMKYKDKPDKLQSVYELTALFDTILQTVAALKKLQDQKKVPGALKSAQKSAKHARASRPFLKEK